MKRAAREGEGTHQETAARLLEIAAADSAVFRGVVGGFRGEEKAFMEIVLKSRAGVQSRRSEDGAGEPSIALKMNF